MNRKKIIQTILLSTFVNGLIYFVLRLHEGHGRIKEWTTDTIALGFIMFFCCMVFWLISMILTPDEK
jgi:hypothetical protein